MQDDVKVTQADREAAGKLHLTLYRDRLVGDPVARELILSGRSDNHHFVQAFARHRHQAERDTLARMEWRDIESAPKDGARFLAWCPYVGRVIMRIDGVHRETWAIDPSGRLGCNPTKWMPLPPAPVVGQ